MRTKVLGLNLLQIGSSCAGDAIMNASKQKKKCMRFTFGTAENYGPICKNNIAYFNYKIITNYCGNLCTSYFALINRAPLTVNPDTSRMAVYKNRAENSLFRFKRKGKLL